MFCIITRTQKLLCHGKFSQTSRHNFTTLSAPFKLDVIRQRYILGVAREPPLIRDQGALGPNRVYMHVIAQARLEKNALGEWRMPRVSNLAPGLSAPVAGLVKLVAKTWGSARWLWGPRFFIANL